MMKNFDLQMYAGAAVSGKRIVYLFRLYSERATAAGTILAFTTENGRTLSNDSDTTATKDGAVRTAGTPEEEITASTLLKQGDEMIDKLETACATSALVECWEANLDEPVTGQENKFKGKYFQGYITEVEKTSNAEDNVEISLTYGVNETGKSGNVTVTAQQQAAASYVFTDSVAAGA